MAASPAFDVAVVGGGFFGCRSALALATKGLKVVLLEREAQLCQRASRINQARIHNGYHYPRSLMTALGSHRHYRRFQRDFAPCVVNDFQHLYAIAGQQSKVNASQFRAFCRTLDIPLKEAPATRRALFDTARIEAVFVADEVAVDTAALGAMMAEQVEEAKGLTCYTGYACTRLENAGSHIRLHIPNDILRARQVLLAGYAGLNPLLAASHLPTLALKTEITEMALVRRPPALEGVGVTVMDGPFFSLMPYGRDGLCTLSHVRYTPSMVTHDNAADMYAATAYARRTLPGRMAHMRNDAARYLPAMRHVQPAGSLWEAKVVPLKNELDDGRPIVFREALGQWGGTGAAIAAVLGSKLDSIYEWEALLHERFS